MKNILTVLLCPGASRPEALPENCEIVELAENEEFKTALKRATGNYALVAERTLLNADFAVLIKKLQTQEAEVVAFGGGFCYKTQFLKGVRRFGTGAAQIFAVLACKSVYKSRSAPFIYAQNKNYFSENAQSALEAAVEEFGKEKAKLSREVYTLAFETLLYELERFYAAAMLEIRKKNLPAENIIKFDNALKDNIVLYLALEKRFKAASLARIRKNKFQVSYFTAKKLKKFLKKNK